MVVFNIDNARGVFSIPSLKSRELQTPWALFIHLCTVDPGMGLTVGDWGAIGVKANRSCSIQYQFLDLICYKMYFGGFFSQKGLILILTKWSIGWPNRFIILQKPEKSFKKTLNYIQFWLSNFLFLDHLATFSTSIGWGWPPHTQKTIPVLIPIWNNEIE